MQLIVNGNPVSLDPQPGEMLVDLLRERLNLTGTKVGCNEAECGACTVLVNGQPVLSCTYPAAKAAGKEVLTIEGLDGDGHLHPIQQAFLNHHAFQCGFCTPGMILNAYALLLKTPRPTREQILRHMDDSLCRCGSHVRVVEAIQEAAGTMKGGA